LVNTIQIIPIFLFVYKNLNKATVPIVQRPTKDFLSLPKTKDELALITYFVFVFEITSNGILAMHASGEFDMKLLDQAISIAKPIPRQIFQFSRQELEKRFNIQKLIKLNLNRDRKLFRVFTTTLYSIYRQKVIEIGGKHPRSSLISDIFAIVLFIKSIS
jgi:hypothetical protein